LAWIMGRFQISDFRLQISDLEAEDQNTPIE
jgi:hypothetical protein